MSSLVRIQRASFRRLCLFLRRAVRSVELKTMHSLRILGSCTALSTILMLGCAGGMGSGASDPSLAPSAADMGTQAPTRLTLVQLNDIYEITPVGGGRFGGPARIATLIRDLEAENPNTLALIAGDFLSPSALGTARVDGERLAGRQMVAVLNTMGLDYATFGNHEFDVSEEAFHARLGEARFQWFSSNVRDREGRPFPGVDDVEILTIGKLRVALMGVTYDGIRPEYVSFLDPVQVIQQAVDTLQDQVDALVAITHLPLDQDVALARAVPELDLILGGHEHENVEIYRGADLTPIFKADANGRSVQVHDLRLDSATGALRIASRLASITDSIGSHPETQAVVEHWLELGYAGFRADGFEPTQRVVQVPVPLDGLESSVRNGPTELSQLIADAMRAEVPGAEVALLNSGSIRIDDVIPPGPITQYDVIRVLPFGGPVVETYMTGTLLASVLDQGEANRGGGGFLASSGVVRAEDGAWTVSGRLLDPDRIYIVAAGDFLLSGREQGLSFLNPDNPDLEIREAKRDVRQALIDELRRRFGG